MRPLRSDGLLLLLWRVPLVGRIARATLLGRVLLVIVRVILVLGAALAFGICFSFCPTLQHLLALALFKGVQHRAGAFVCIAGFLD